MQARNEFSKAAHPPTLYPDEAQHAAVTLSATHMGKTSNRPKGHTEDRSHYRQAWVCFDLIWSSYAELGKGWKAEGGDLRRGTLWGHVGDWPVPSSSRQFKGLPPMVRTRLRSCLTSDVGVLGSQKVDGPNRMILARQDFDRVR